MADPLEHTALDKAARDRFRLQVKFFFLTWPQCSLDPQVILDRLSRIPSFDYAVVSRENHRDATGLHIHAFVAFTKQQNKVGCKWLDALADKHGNYQSARDKTAVVRYVIKDGDFVSSPGFDPHAFLEAARQHKSSSSAIGSKSRSEEIARLIRDEGKSLDELDDLAPGHVYMNKRKIQDYAAYQVVKKARFAILPWPGIDMTLFPEGDYNHEIAKWLHANIKVGKRELKTKQLFIWSCAPDVGKTHLTMELEKYLVTYHPPRGQYIDGYESGRFDLVVFDEFRSDWPIQVLNEFVQGSKVHLNQKGCGHLKTDNPPMILLANSDFAGIYHKKVGTPQFEALLARFTVVEVPRGGKIDIFKTWH